ncbi:hypothetical protein LTR66_001633 [Elasticomyces elasticus]|nr:hypothetical protein LTR66_001633 [Elasticomyces elasticus]
MTTTLMMAAVTPLEMWKAPASDPEAPASLFAASDGEPALVDRDVDGVLYGIAAAGASVSCAESVEGATDVAKTDEVVGTVVDTIEEKVFDLVEAISEAMACTVDEDDAAVLDIVIGATSVTKTVTVACASTLSE